MAKLPDATLREWQKKYPDFAVVRRLKSGKEADVWLVSANGQLYALKLYTEHFLSTRSKYSEGQWIREASLRKAIQQKTKVGRNLQSQIWTKREYYLLSKLREQGAVVPEVYAYTNNAILMQYLGDQSSAAPRLIEVTLNPEIKAAVRAAILESIKLFLEQGIVHADLSPYNILWWENKPWVIDFPQAADIRHIPTGETPTSGTSKTLRAILARRSYSLVARAGGALLSLAIFTDDELLITP